MGRVARFSQIPLNHVNPISNEQDNQNKDLMSHPYNKKLSMSTKPKKNIKL
jgi:hypothetical protein